MENVEQQCRRCGATLGSLLQCPACGLQTPTDPLLGRTLNNQYKILRKIGSGGFGAVYEAEEPGLSRKVAVKVLHQDLTRDPTIVARFRREGFAAAQLEHPSAVRIFSSGETEDGLLYLVMELLQGESLSAFLEKNGALPLSALLGFLRPICEVLAEAHRKGVVHRDIKPANIFLLENSETPQKTEGQTSGPIAHSPLPIPSIKVLDFGIARLIGESPITKTSIAMGTPAYMAPELWEEKATPDGRADLYALGLVLYGALSQKFPFEASSPSAWVRKHCLEAPIPLSEALRGTPLPDGLEAALMRSLAKDPNERYPDALSMLKAFEEVLGALPSSASQAPKSAPKSSFLWWVAASLALVLVGLGLYWGFSSETKKILPVASNRPRPQTTPPKTSQDSASTISYQEEWLHPVSGGDDLFAVVSADGQTFFAFGRGGTMLRSSDKVRWERLPKRTDNTLKDAFVRGSSIYVAGAKGTLLFSKDSGTSWSIKQLGERDLNAVFAVSEKEVALAGEGGRLFVSKDGGETFREYQVGTGAYDLTSLWGGSLEGLYVGASLPPSSDDATFWDQYLGPDLELRPSLLSPVEGGAIFCPEGEQTWAICSTQPKRVLDIIGNAQGQLFAAVKKQPLLRSDDQGKTWIAEEIQGVLPLRDIYQFATAPDGRLCALGENWLSCRDEFKIWSNRIIEIENLQSAEHMRGFWIDPTSLLAVGMGGQIWAFGERDWRPISHSFVSAIRSVWASSRSDIYLAPRSRSPSFYPESPLASHDGGKSWSAIELQADEGAEINPPCYWSLFGSERAIYAVGDPGLLFASDNQGKTSKLIAQEADAWQDIYGVWSDPAGERLHLIGEGGLLRTSRNGGKTWETSKVVEGALFDLWVGAEAIFVSGQYGTFLRSTDQGKSWKKLEGIDTRYRLNGVYSDGRGVVYVAASFENNEGAVFRSPDNGEHWEKVLTSPKPLWDVTISAAGHAIVVGEASWSSANGKDWKPFLTGTTAHFSRLFSLPTGEVLAAGEFGALLLLSPQ